MKLCRTCNTEKDNKYFYKRAASKDGLSAKCAECQKKYDKDRANSPERVKARKEYQLTDKGKDASFKAKKKYAENNKDKCSEAKRIYRENNREKIRELGRRKYRENKEYYLESSRSYKERFPKKYKAVTAVNNAIRDKLLFKEPCEICGEIKVHGHHDDYAKPLNVRWLCVAHHQQWHAENGEGANA